MLKQTLVIALTANILKFRKIHHLFKNNLLGVRCVVIVE